MLFRSCDQFFSIKSYRSHVTRNTLIATPNRHCSSQYFVYADAGGNDSLLIQGNALTLNQGGTSTWEHGISTDNGSSDVYDISNNTININTHVIGNVFNLGGKAYTYNNTVTSTNDQWGDMIRVESSAQSTIYSNVFNMAGSRDDDRVMYVAQGATVNIYKNTFITQSQPGN